MPANDPFRDARESRGVLEAEFQGDVLPMILGYKDVRAAAADWRTYSSDAPFRVPIPSEEAVRSVRQLPVEIDPPEHTDYRKIVEPFFRRPKEPEMIAKIEALIGELIREAAARGETEIVRQFALPLQSRSLTHLLNVPETEAEEWISWGVHVFKEGMGERKGEALERYIHAQLDKAAAAPGDDFFSALTQATFRGRPLTREEMVGFANLAFAGGRDTIIQTVASVIGWLAEHPEGLELLRRQPETVNTAAEEFFRWVSPLTHIGRVCPQAAEVKGVPVAADTRVSLCWASANRDAGVFEAPDELRLDRKPNPHIAFGAGVHACLGAHHARLITRTLLRQLSERLSRIEPVEAVPHVEKEVTYQRELGYERLVVRLVPRAAAGSQS